jgi:hypothetical protein
MMVPMGVPSDCKISKMCSRIAVRVTSAIADPGPGFAFAVSENIYDPVKFARSPSLTPSLGIGGAGAIANFAVVTIVGDIIAVNGQPAKGLYAGRTRVINCQSHGGRLLCRREFTGAGGKRNPCNDVSNIYATHVTTALILWIIFTPCRHGRDRLVALSLHRDTNG